MKVGYEFGATCWNRNVFCVQKKGKKMREIERARSIDPVLAFLKLLCDSATIGSDSQ